MSPAAAGMLLPMLLTQKDLPLNIEAKARTLLLELHSKIKGLSCKQGTVQLHRTAPAAAEQALDRVVMKSGVPACRSVLSKQKDPRS